MFRVHIADAFMQGGTAVYVVNHRDGRTYLGETEPQGQGRLMFSEHEPGSEFPHPTLLLPRGMIEPLRDALNEHTPPPGRDLLNQLREDLAIERDRVDLLLGRATIMPIEVRP